MRKLNTSLRSENTFKRFWFLFVSGLWFFSSSTDLFAPFWKTLEFESKIIRKHWISVDLVLIRKNTVELSFWKWIYSHFKILWQSRLRLALCIFNPLTSGACATPSLKEFWTERSKRKPQLPSSQLTNNRKVVTLV